MMLRGRIPKFNKIQGRNLQNLHVIPTATVATCPPTPTVATCPPTATVATCPSNQLMPSLIPVTNSGTNPRMDFYNQNLQNNDYNFNKGRKKKRQRKNHWNNPSYLKPVMCNTKSLKEETVVEEDKTAEIMEVEETKMEETEKIETPSDTLAEENYFEEVEVASVEADAKQEILVGYRKTKRHYLKYRKKNFFRPKIFQLSERTFVNCLNLQDDIDVDVVSEAEYEYETDHMDRSDSHEMLNKFIEIDEAHEDPTEEGIVENQDNIDRNKEKIRDEDDCNQAKKKDFNQSKEILNDVSNFAINTYFL